VSTRLTTAAVSSTTNAHSSTEPVRGHRAHMPKSSGFSNDGFLNDRRVSWPAGAP
jgi:hypothetical protein